MVYININQTESVIVLDCHKGSENGEAFRLIIDPVTRKLLEKPENPDIDASAAYSRVYNLLADGAALPKKTVAAWG